MFEHEICNVKGAGHEVCQDSCLFAEGELAGDHFALAVVCDGVGGLASGEVASATVVARFAEWVTGKHEIEKEGLLAYVESQWSELIKEVNAALFSFGSHGPDKSATTLSAVLICGNRCLTCHVGDSRIYSLCDSGSRQLTKDHTIVEKLLSSGQITKEEAAVHPKRHFVTRAVGAQDVVKPEFAFPKLEPLSTYLVCTDGFYEEMGDSLRSALAGGDALSAACDKALVSIKEAGEEDDITAILFRMIDPGETVAESQGSSAPRRTIFAGDLGKCD